MSEPFDPGWAWWEWLIAGGITACVLGTADLPIYTLVLLDDPELHRLADLALGLIVIVWLKLLFEVRGLHRLRIKQGWLLPRRRAAP